MTKTKIIQVTDTHIMPIGQDWHSPETKTASRLSKVVEHINVLHPDAVIMTGDAVDTRSKDAYDHLKNIITNLTPPIYFIPGNHDDRDEMRNAFSDKSYMPKEGHLHYVIDEFPVRLIGLDTNIKNANGGELTETSLDWLSNALNNDMTKPTLLFMHHFPFEVGQPIFDTILCDTTPRFTDIIKNAPNVIGIVAGHYHNQLSTTFADKPFFVGKSVAPSHHFSDDGWQVTGLKLDPPAITIHTYDHDTGDFFSQTEIVSDDISYSYCFNG